MALEILKRSLKSILIILYQVHVLAAGCCNVEAIRLERSDNARLTQMRLVVERLLLHVLHVELPPAHDLNLLWLLPHITVL